MPFCAYCGKAIGGVRFCPHCGRPAGPVPESPAHSPRPVSRLKVTLALAGVGSMLAAVVGSLLPWVSYSSGNVGGIHRDGKIMIALGLVGLVFGVLGLVLEYAWPFYALALLGISIAALSLLDIIDVSTTPGLGLSSVGIGLFIGAAAGIVAVISGVGGISLHTDS